MNFAYHSSNTNLLQPSRLDKPNKNEKILDSLPVDDEREIDDETLQQQLDSFLNYQEEDGKCDLSKLHQGDYLLQFYMLKLEKRINILRKTYEEGPWNGNENIGIIVILRNLISILETLVELFSEHINAIKIETDRFNNVINLLLYCDNLEINYLVSKFVLFTECNQALKTLDNCRLLENYYLFFINVWRQRYPYIAEIFKNEKFYKDTGSKPLGNDVQGDQAFYENSTKESFKLEINSVKKEYSDFFSSYYQTQQLLAKDNIQPPNKITPLFVNIMLTLRLAKNFSAVKNRALIASLQCLSYASGQRYASCIEALKKFQVSKDYRLIYAMKNFPYPDYQLDMLWCFIYIKDKSQSTFNIEEDNNVDYETRFVDDFRAKFINEDESDFVENAKLDDAARYYEQFAGIYKSMKVDVLNKLSTKNSPHLNKLEQDSNELLNNLVKYFTLSINRLNREIKQANDEDSVNRTGNVLYLFRLFYVNSYFFEVNAEHIGKEAAPIIEALKQLYTTFSTFSRQANNQEIGLPAFNFFRLINHRLLALKSFFRNEMREFLTTQELFDNCFNGYKSGSQLGSMGTKIIFFHCDILAKVFLQNGDDERFQNTCEVVADYIKINNLSMNPFKPANMVLNAFIKKFGDSLQHAQLVEKINYIRFCYCNLIADKPEDEVEQDEEKQEDEESSNSKNAQILLTSDIIDSSFSKFSNKFLTYFNQYLDEKIPILEEDKQFETTVIERFPNFQKNSYVRSFVESLISTNAFRSSSIQNTFFQNFINILSKVPTFLNENDTLNLLRRSLELFHYCSVDFKITLLYYLNIPKESKLFYEENKEKIPMLQLFIQLFCEVIEKSENTLTFLPYQGMSKNWQLGQRNTLSIGDHTSILISNYDPQNIASLGVVKQLCALYGLFKTQTKSIIKDKVKLSNENLNYFIVKARKLLPSLIATHIPQKVKYYINKMDFNFEQNFVKTQQNPQVKKQVLTYIYTALLYKGVEKTDANKYVISRTFMGDVDAFHSIKKGLEKYFVGLPQQLLKVVHGDPANRLIIDDLSSTINNALLSELLTGQIRTDNIRDAFQDLAINLVAEQEIRKTINFSSLKATFDQSEYYKKLSDLTNNILIAFRKFKISLEILKILKDESSLTRESWYKYQFFILTMVFIRWWFQVFSKKKIQSQVILCENIYIFQQHLFYAFLVFIGGLQKKKYIRFQNPHLQLLITIDELLLGIQQSPSLLAYPEVLKVLILDSNDKLRNTSAKEHCIQFFINSINIRHFFLSNTYEGSFDLEFNNFAQLDNAPPEARIFIGQYLARLFGEISRTGIALQSEECKSIASAILYLQLKDERANIAAACTHLQQMAIDLFKEYDPNFKANLYPATDIFVSMKITKPIDQLPDGLKSFVECLKKEIVNTPQVNKAALLGTLSFIIIDIVNKYETWIIKSSKYDRDNIVQFFMKMFDIYLDYLNISPQNLRHAIINVSNMFKMLQIWLHQLNIYLIESAKISPKAIDNQVLVALLSKSIQAFDKILDYLEAPLFKDYSKYSKLFSPYPVLRSLFGFISYTLSKLKYTEINVDSQLEQATKTLFRFTNIHYDDFILERISGTKNTNNLWTPMMRCFEMIFTFQKENFLKSCIEIRIKNSLYIAKEKRFQQYWDLKDFEGKKIIKRDMLEHGRCLRQVIATLFEGLPEDMIDFEEDYEPEKEKLNDLPPEAEEPKEGEEGQEGEEKQEGEGEEGEGDAEQNPAEEEPAEVQEQEQPDAGVEENENPSQGERDEGEEIVEGDLEQGSQQQGEDGGEGEMDQEGQEGEVVLVLEDGQPSGEGVEYFEEFQEGEQNGELIQEGYEGGERLLDAPGRMESVKVIEDKRKVRFRFYQNVDLQTSKIVKLNNLQKQIIDKLIDLIESRINDSYNQSKDKQANSETASFNIFYIEYPFAIKTLQMFMQKYPLVIPYILEKRIRIPEFSIFKKNNIVSFLDFLIIGGSVSEFMSNQILEVLIKMNYAYSDNKKVNPDGEEEEEGEEQPQENVEEQVEEGEDGGSPKAQVPIKKKPKPIPITGTSQKYFEIIVERCIIWTKKLIETKNFINMEGCFTILYGLVGNMKFFITHFSSYVSSQQFKNILSILVELIKKKCSNQQELFKLIQINIFTLMRECLEYLPQRLFQDRNINVEFSTAMDYINYYVNRNILSYFEKEKGLELEKNSTFNHLDIFNGINTNLKENPPKIHQISSQLDSTGPLDKTSPTKNKDNNNVSKELLLEEQAFEGLFHTMNVIQSIDELYYQHHQQFQFGLQALYDFYNIYPNIFAKKEHTMSFIYCLSHLYVVLRRQTEFDKDDYSLLETVYHHCPKNMTQFEIIDEIIYKEIKEQSRLQKEKEEQKRAQEDLEKLSENSQEGKKPPLNNGSVSAPGNQISASNLPMSASFQNFLQNPLSGSFQNFAQEMFNFPDGGIQFAENMNLLQNVIRQARDAVQVLTDRNSQGQRNNIGANELRSIQSNQINSDTYTSAFDFSGMGYPSNALQLYHINENDFYSSNIDQKTEMLKEGHKKYQLQQKLQFVIAREKDLLEKFMQKINQQVFQKQNPNQQPKLNEAGSHQENHEEEEKGEASGAHGVNQQRNTKDKQIPDIPHSLRVYIQQNIIDFFNDLKPKDQRVQALSWDEQLMQQMPQSIQQRIKNIKEDLQSRFTQSKAKKEVNSEKSDENEYEELQEFEEDVAADKLPDNLLFSELEKIPSVDKVLKHQHLLLEMVPTFDDEFLLKLFEALHIFTDKTKYQSQKTVVELIGIICQNPYNAFRIVDLFSFLLFLYPRRAKVTNDSLNQNGLMQLVDTPILVLDKQISYRAEVDKNYWKLSNYVNVLYEIFSYNQCHALFGLYDYPLTSLEEYKVQVGRSEQQSKPLVFQVQFRQFDQLKDVKLAALIKGQKDGITLNNLVNFSQKWIASEKNLQSSVLVYQYPESSFQIITEPFDRFNQIFYQNIQYNGLLKANYDSKYPVLYRPWKELIMEELNEQLTSEILLDIQKKKRLAESSSYTLLVDKCKTFTIFLDFAKQYMRISVKKYHPELKRLQASFIHKRTQTKQNRGLDDLNDQRTTLVDILDYNNFLEQFRTFLHKDLELFKKSIKDITSLFKIAEKEELKHLLDEFKDRDQENGREAAIEWYKAEKQKVSQRMTQDVRHVILVEDNSVMSFFLDLLQFMIQSINYAWSLEEFIIPGYSYFDYPLKCILTLYDFLYPEEKKKKMNPAEEFVGEELPDDSLPQLSKLMTKAPEDMMDSVGQGMSMTKTMNALMSTNSSKQFQGVDMTQLYELILNYMNKLIQYLINSYDVKSKKKWVEISNIIAVDVKSSRRLDAEKKMAKAAQFSKFLAKKRVKGAERKIFINCQRDHPWNSSLGDLMNYSPDLFILQKFDVVFEGESGIDQGGLSMEWIVLALNDILDPQKGLFKVSSNGITIQPSPHSYLVPNHLTHFRFAGRLIAKGLIEKFDFEVDFTKSFLKHILHKTLYISDLEDIDPDEANNLLWILDHDVTGLSLTYCIERSSLGENYTVDLIPNGRNIEVTEENKKDFVKQIANFKMTEEIKEQVQSFLKGFYEILPQKSLKYMTEQELGLLLSGVKKIDVEDMRKYTKYYGYSKDSQVIQWFFEVMEEFDEDQRSLFLFFTTGSFKVPFGGFKNLQLELAKIDNKENLPVAHTCTKSLDLPEYDTKEILKEKLTIAIQEGKQGFHIA